MSQIKIYGLRTNLNEIKLQLSDIIHNCIVETLQLPISKRFHRFINLDKDDFLYPKGRTDAYIIIEILMISGRTSSTKKRLIKMLIKKINEQLHISLNDIEITIIESEAFNWGFRGLTGDEVNLNYKLNI